jgi:hypothetical protein
LDFKPVTVLSPLTQIHGYLIGLKSIRTLTVGLENILISYNFYNILMSNFVCIYYQRNEDKPKYLFLNYRRNEDEAMYLLLNYRRNEDEAK